ncbi:MAG: carbohydrate ABC transporter permease [Chloroflexota bacterium]|jgi:multiple sugar transport system permease protein|nr:carbohydrate ABC transporter permease [Chloroflexota bacterium]
MSSAVQTPATDAGLRARQGRGRRHLVGRAALYVLATILALWVLFPIYLITITAFSPRDVVREYPKNVIPQEFSTESMNFFVNSTGVLGSLWNSVLVAVITLILSTAIGAPAGYALARFVFKGRDPYRLIILSTRAFPIVILSIPLAVTFLTWGIYDSIWAVALMHTALAMPFTILITGSIFVSVPRDLEEAALTLGCTPLQAFIRVVMPLALPGLAAASIFTFVLSWNEVFAAVILTLQERTLPAQVLATLTSSPPHFRFAAAWFMLAPSLIFIFLIRRYLLGLWGRVSR